MIINVVKYFYRRDCLCKYFKKLKKGNKKERIFFLHSIVEAIGMQVLKFFQQT